MLGILEEKPAVLPPPPMMTRGGSPVTFIEDMPFVYCKDEGKWDEE